jgi:predicted O-linked N-acetylglucosamine transferase (SPINDLY family)
MDRANLQRLQQAARLITQRQLREADDICRAVLAREPNHPQALHLLGASANAADQAQVAIDYLQSAIAQRDDVAEFHNSLGLALLKAERVEDAVSAFRRAIEIDPDNMAAHGNLGNALKRSGDDDGAAGCYMWMLEREPTIAQVHYNLGRVYAKQKRLAEAIACFRQAIELSRDLSEPHDDLANALKDQGLVREAVEHYRIARQKNHRNETAVHNLLFTLHYLPETTHDDIDALLAQWREDFVLPLPDIQSHANPRDPDRRLRVGFVSANLRQHPHGVMLEPLLEHIDRNQYHVACYTARGEGDAISARLRRLADQWTPVYDLPADVAARRMRDDGVDILIDMARHTGRPKLDVFRHKPAPVQITWLGGPPTSSGLPTMDYLVTDRMHLPHAEPHRYREKLLYLPIDYICYRDPHDAPPVNVREDDRVTFASFNVLSKITDDVLALWAKLLDVVDGSMLFIKTPALDCETTCALTRDRFAAQDGNPDRLILEGRSPHDEMMAAYHRADIALDPFPYSGGLTTCEALWMGVPVVTINEPGFAVRHSVSHLAAAGLSDWIAASPQQYLDIAAQWARDRDRLTALRRELRQRVAASSLCNVKAYAAAWESMLREVWHAHLSEHA